MIKGSVEVWSRLEGNTEWQVMWLLFELFETGDARSNCTRYIVHTPRPCQMDEFDLVSMFHADDTRHQSHLSTARALRAEIHRLVQHLNLDPNGERFAVLHSPPPDDEL